MLDLIHLSDRRVSRRPLALIAGLVLSVCLAAGGAAAQTTATGPSGLALPRYVSLKADRVNVRRGPGRDYPIAWVFQRAGLPVEVVKEYDHWRRVRDSEGALGWVHVRLLSGRRTALVLPWKVKKQNPEPVPVHASASRGASPLALVQPGTVADVIKCDGTWCRVAIQGYRGWLEQKLLWGVYENEHIE